MTLATGIIVGLYQVVSLRLYPIIVSTFRWRVFGVIELVKKNGEEAEFLSR
jgi:hypothetical protein